MQSDSYRFMLSRSRQTLQTTRPRRSITLRPTRSDTSCIHMHAAAVYYWLWYCIAIIVVSILRQTVTLTELSQSNDINILQQNLAVLSLRMSNTVPFIRTFVPTFPLISVSRQYCCPLALQPSVLSSTFCSSASHSQQTPSVVPRSRLSFGFFL